MTSSDLSHEDGHDRGPGDDAPPAPFDAGISPDDPRSPLLGLQEEEAIAVEDGVIR